MPVALDTVYSAIGQISDRRRRRGAGQAGDRPGSHVDFASEKDTRKDKIRKTIEALQRDGNERWLLTYVLIRAVAQEKLCRKIIDAFPKTLVGLPLADGQVTSALTYLQQLLNTPFPPGLKYELKPKRTSFAKIVQAIATLVAYKNLHECLLKLLFALPFDECSRPVRPTMWDRTCRAFFARSTMCSRRRRTSPRCSATTPRWKRLDRPTHRARGSSSLGRRRVGGHGRHARRHTTACPDVPCAAERKGVRRGTEYQLRRLDA